MPPNNPLAYLSQGTGEEVDARKSAAAGLPVDAQGFKTNQMGNDIDAAGARFLQSIFGIEPPKQVPLDVDMGPPMPTRGDGRPAVNNGIQVSPVPRPVDSISEYTDKLINFPRTETEGFGAAENTRGRVPVAPPETLMEPRPPGEPRQASTQPPPAQPPKVSTGTPPVTKTAAEPPVQTTAAVAPGTSRPTAQQSGLEYAMNVGGRVVDDVVDEFGNVVNEAVNIGDRFINRPGSERASRIAGRDADIQAWNDKYSGNIGTELLDAIQARGGWGSALGGMTDEVKNFVMNLFDPNRGGTANVAPEVAPQSPPVTSAQPTPDLKGTFAAVPPPATAAPERDLVKPPPPPQAPRQDVVINEANRILEDNPQLLEMQGDELAFALQDLGIDRDVLLYIHELVTDQFQSSNVGITDVKPPSNLNTIDYGV
jgi:hypothetical protein